MAITSKKDITVTVLKKVATELNKLMGLKPEIETGGKPKKADLEREIIDAAGSLEPDDKLTTDTAAALKVLGVDLPEPKSEPKKASGKKASATPKADAAPRFTRIMAVAQAMAKLGADDKEAIAVEADKLYGNSNIKESKWATNVCFQFFDALQEATGKKISL
jgi:hypothetical protein